MRGDNNPMKNPEVAKKMSKSRKGIASFRRTEFGSLEHLYQKEPASFAARFCETFEDDSRHD